MFWPVLAAGGSVSLLSCPSPRPRRKYFRAWDCRRRHRPLRGPEHRISIKRDSPPSGTDRADAPLNLTNRANCWQRNSRQPLQAHPTANTSSFNTRQNSNTSLGVLKRSPPCAIPTELGEYRGILCARNRRLPPLVRNELSEPTIDSRFVLRTESAIDVANNFIVAEDEGAGQRARVECNFCLLIVIQQPNHRGT